MNTATLKNYIRSLIDRYEVGGTPALNDEEREYLALLFAGDARKGEFVVGDATDAVLRKSFCEHVRKSFLDGEIRVVLDLRAALERQAADLSADRRPVPALILFATWIEHWLNAIHITTAIRRGLSDAQAEQLVRDVPLRAKLGWLFTMLELPPLEDQHRKAIVEITDLRNAYVHYKWSGRTPEELEAEEAKLRELVRSAPATVEYLRQYEQSHLTADLMSAAKRLFDVEL